MAVLLCGSKYQAPYQALSHSKGLRTTQGYLDEVMRPMIFPHTADVRE